MILFQTIFFLILVSAVSLAFMRGGTSERLVAVALTLAAVATPIVAIQRFASPEIGVVIVDLALFLALAVIALRADTFWPIWAAGFQLGGLAVHAAAAWLPHMVPSVYMDALGIWSFPVVLALIVGTSVEDKFHHGRA